MDSAGRLRPLCLAAVLGLALSVGISGSSGTHGQHLVRRDPGSTSAGADAGAGPDAGSGTGADAGTDTGVGTGTDAGAGIDAGVVAEATPTVPPFVQVNTPPEYLRSEVDMEQDPNLKLDGGGWELVRHISGDKPDWGPWTDRLAGLADVGPVTGPQGHNHWTVPFTDKVADEFLFATVDGKVWLIADAIAINSHGNNPRVVKTSFGGVDKSSVAKGGRPKVTWVNGDRGITITVWPKSSSVDIYREASSKLGVWAKNRHGGINVYMRR